MPQFDTVLTTGEVQFLKESFFGKYPGVKCKFTPDGEYAVRARIDVPNDEQAGIFQQSVAKMRADRLKLEAIHRMPAVHPHFPRVEIDRDDNL